MSLYNCNRKMLKAYKTSIYKTYQKITFIVECHVPLLRIYKNKSQAMIISYALINKIML